MPPKATSARNKSLPSTTTTTSAAAASSAVMGTHSMPQGGTQEVTTHVQGLMQQMQARFDEMSKSIISRIDEMTSRIDDLEHSIDDLMQQSGVEEGDKGAARPKK